MSRADTIAAIATAPGRAGVAVVRVSGPDAFAVGRAVAGRDPEPGSVRYVRFRRDGAVVDDGILLVFRAPASYTGEDVVEFQCHGGAVAPRRVLEACFAAGARLARRGEFTERAFLNGRLGYEEAEAVIDLIDAKTERAADAARAGFSGARRKAVSALYDRALALSAELEHALDVSEEELPDGFLAGIDARAEVLASSVDAEIRRAREGHILRNGALVVLAGAPNVGKSSLMNALLGAERAIVSELAGTTRDSIEEWLDVAGWPVRLVDTAGVREAASATDKVEAEGIRRAEDLARRADIVLRLREAGGDRFTEAVGEREMLVCTKADLASSGAVTVPAGAVRVSVVTGEGLDALRAAIAARLERLAAAADEAPGEAGGVPAELIEVHARLAVRPDDIVLLANLLREVAAKLGELSGAVYSEDLLERLFSRFCVGK